MTDDPAGVPLAHYLDHPGTRVSLICNACAYSETWDLAGTIARLDSQGINGREFGIRALAARVKKACRCGARDWETRPSFQAGRMGFSR